MQNNKDYFDQSLDEIKLLNYINEADPDDEHGMLRLFDYFYYKVGPCPLLSSMHSMFFLPMQSGQQICAGQQNPLFPLLPCLESLFRILPGQMLCMQDLSAEESLSMSQLSRAS